MHFFQAIKMACKSLWTHKLRSFLTMLGIIIGVITVSLLITVTQGVSTAIVSSIRSQSTMSFMFNISNRLTNKSASSIIKNVQPTDKTAKDYFDYSLVSYTASLTANDSLAGFDGDMIADFLTADRIYTMADFPSYDSMTPEEQGIVKLLLMKKKGSLKTNVFAVDSSFKDVYDLKFEGNYFSKPNEILVDNTFIDTYFGEEVLNADAIGRIVTLGVTNYTNIKLVYPEPLSEFKIKSIMDIVTKEYEVETGKDINGNPIINKVSLDILLNDDGTNFIYKEVTNEDETKSYEISININIIPIMTNEELKEKFLEVSKTPSIAYLFNKSEIFVDDIYEKDNAKEYKIVGIVDDSSNSIINDFFQIGNDKKDNNENTIFKSYMQSMTSSRGNCYMMLDDENVKCLYQDRDLTVESSVVSFGYFKYKTEDVISASITNLVVSFATAGYGYMSEFLLISFNSVANIISNVMDILTLLLSVISVISLLVGGIGIMNIMLVAVTERTKEIGIRKAIGAKKSSILLQFLIESLLISLIGCIIGLVLSFIGILIISNIMGIKILMPIWVILMSVGFCLLIGLIFGVFPAIKASNMQPIDALRKE